MPNGFVVGAKNELLRTDALRLINAQMALPIEVDLNESQDVCLRKLDAIDAPIPELLPEVLEHGRGQIETVQRPRGHAAPQHGFPERQGHDASATARVQATQARA